MQEIRISKGIKRITIPQSVSGQPTLVYKAKGKKKRKKQSRGLRGLEKLLRRGAKSQETYADAYLRRHKRSNRKKRDGWMKDLASNMVRAQDKSRKKLKLNRLLRW